MIITHAWPPNIDAIKARFPGVHDKVLFAYGDTLYNPSGDIVPDHLLEHEKVHQRQQALLGPAVWWDKYLTDNAFLLSQEIEAYHVQYKFFCRQTKNKEAQLAFLRSCARALSSPLYGNTIGTAVAFIRIRFNK